MSFVVAGFSLAIMAIVFWWDRRSAGFKRAWAGVACAFGGFLLRSVTG